MKYGKILKREHRREHCASFFSEEGGKKVRKRAVVEDTPGLKAFARKIGDPEAKPGTPARAAFEWLRPVTG
jgi:hypothetical protein